MTGAKGFLRNDKKTKQTLFESDKKQSEISPIVEMTERDSPTENDKKGTIRNS